MSFYLAYWIVWWLAVLSNAVAAYFVMIATVTAYSATYSFEVLIGVGTGGTALLAVIVLTWSLIPTMGPRNALIYRIAWWFAFVSNAFRTLLFGALACLSAYVFFFGTLEPPADWLSYVGLCGTALLALIVLLWGLSPPMLLDLD